MESNRYQKLVMDVLGTRPISFNPDLALILGSVTASLFLCQLLYWWKKGKHENMIWKTVKELQKETTLTKAQQLHAQKICIKKGLLKVLYKGIPPKRHFQLEVDKIIELLEDAYFDESKPFKRRKRRHSNVNVDDIHIFNSNALITESTQESTKTESTKHRMVEKSDAEKTEEFLNKLAKVRKELRIRKPLTSKEV